LSSDPLVGLVLGRYRLQEQLGAGGMGVVYRAHDERLNRDVAVKVLPPGRLVDEATRRRFRHEAQALARLNHPNIATIFDFDSDGTTDFLVMELLTGQTVAYQLLSGPLAPPVVIRFGIEMAEGLAAAHQQDILHRDLKPGNLGLSADGRVKVLDFGIAKLLKADPADATQTQTETGLIKGTLAYMSPEQLRGQAIDLRADIYAAGAVLYEMATGERPHAQARGPLLVDAILNQSLEPPSSVNPSVTPGLDAVILKALAKDRGLRYQTAQELASDLKRLQTATVPIAVRHAGRARLRRLLLLALLATGVLALAVASWKASRSLPARAANGPRPMLLVGEFENRTGEPVFDNTLHEMFTASLEQSHVVQVFPTSRLVDVLQRMGRPPTQRVDEGIGREICQREGLQGLLTGSIVRLGRTYVLLARTQSPSGSDIITTQVSAANPDDVPARVDEIAQQVRRKLGESRQSLEEHSLPLATVTSSSLEAVRYFTLAKQSLYDGDPSQAVLLFTKALELDPNFAVAHEYLGAGYHYLNKYELSVEEIRRAAQLTNRVSEPERLRIMAAYYATLLDFGKECDNYQLLAQLKPLDPAPYINLGVCNKERYDYAAAASSTEKALQLVPKSDVRINLASHLLAKGDNEQAYLIAQSFSREFSNNLWAQTVLGRVYLALGRLQDAQATFGGMMQLGPDAAIAAHLSLADVSLATGRYGDARQELEAAIEAAERDHNRTAEAKARIALAEMLIQKGSPPEAARALLAQVDLPAHTPSLNFLLARTYASTGHLQPAQTTLRDIDSLINEHDVPALQALRSLMSAEIALAQRRFADAVNAAQKAVAYQNSVLAVETLARCYAAAGQQQQAIDQYRILLTRANELLDDTRVESFDEPAYHRAIDAHYRLGILYRELGRWGDSRTELQTFLDYWAHADADVELYRTAQRLLRALPPSGVPTPAT
jgi:tetratricopeptide (TPR) repeat protein